MICDIFELKKGNFISDQEMYVMVLNIYASDMKNIGFALIYFYILAYITQVV